MAKRKIKEVTIDGRKYKYTGSKPMAERIKSAKGKPGAKELSKAGKIMAKKIGKKSAASVAKKVAGKVVSRVIPSAGVVLTAAEIAKGAKKVGKSMKAKSDCQKRGGIYKKGFCISSKSIKAKSVKKK